MLSRRDRRGAVLRWKTINSRYSHARAHALMKPLLTDKFGITFLILVIGGLVNRHGGAIALMGWYLMVPPAPVAFTIS